ncbi:MAG TPA: peptidoglycan bridge formation glycyltransferase FemA/FemB family protein [Ignavibacteriaceae bacterium]|nr:peptidoglycan bridge formation glycyltransferase FemA/FemB family protein [Ignavibacteriaceae bacterium]
MSVSQNIEIINPLEYNGWNEKITEHQDYTFFHTAEWTKLISETYGYNPVYHITKSHDKITGILPLMEVRSFLTGKRGISLPFSDFSNPLVTDSVQFNQLLESAKEYGRKSNWKYLEINGAQSFLPAGTHSYLEYEHIIDLDGNEDNLFSGFDSTTKRNIRKAIKENVKVYQDHSLEAVNQFYKLNSITRQRHGLPPQPYSFFKNLYTIIIKNNSGTIFLAEKDNEILAGAVYLHIGKKALYKFGASNMNYQKLRANNLVMWEAIKWYNSNGYSEFSFGKTEPDNEGLRRFKNGWSVRELESHTYRFGIPENKFLKFSTQTSGFHNKIFNNLPLPVLEMFGSFAYRHFA